VAAFARSTRIDKHIVAARGKVGIVTAGKAHFDFMEVLRRLDLDPNAAGRGRRAGLQAGLVYPLEATRMLAFAQGLTDLLVIEEKAPVVERQIKERCSTTSRPSSARGWSARPTRRGAPLLSALGELRPSRLIAVVAAWLARLNPALDRRDLVRDFTVPALLSNAADAKRQPYFCSGCPHNTSTKRARGLARARRHRLPLHGQLDGARHLGPDPDGRRRRRLGGRSRSARPRMSSRTSATAPTTTPATWRSARPVAARANITYKILYNDAVAMTGGQPVDGQISVPQIARQVEARA
jgi:indolepyruvate ferredoxin oxidoreductase